MMPADCLDLQTLFGEKYRVLRDKVGELSDYGRRLNTPDPWLLFIPCKFGEIFPHGGNLLAASTKVRGDRARRLLTLPCCRIHQDGDDGVTVVFDVADFDVIAAVMEPKRRVRWSPEYRARMEASGRLFAKAST